MSICEKEFCTDINNDEYKKMRKVRNHCHYTGKYRGAAHSKCNLEYKIVKEIPVLFCIWSIYDYHFIDNDVLIKRFYNTYQLSDNDINKFKLLLRKGYILMNIWIVGKDLMKQSYHQKVSFIVN